MTNLPIECKFKKVSNCPLFKKRINHIQLKIKKLLWLKIQKDMIRQKVPITAIFREEDSLGNSAIHQASKVGGGGGGVGGCGGGGSGSGGGCGGGGSGSGGGGG